MIEVPRRIFQPIERTPSSRSTDPNDAQNIHGECASDHKKNITIMNAESSFLPTLKAIHTKFPKLKIVLEHCTTADAVKAVEACGDTVVGTITAHHL